MAEVGKVRLVRCPQCENLLPEMPDFSVYQCGGCGAILRGTLLSLSFFLSMYVFVMCSAAFCNYTMKFS